MDRIALFAAVSVCTLSYTLQAQVSPVRSSVTSDSHIYLTPDQGDDQAVVIDDQNAMNEVLVAVADTQIENSNGSFSGMVTGSVVFENAGQGSFAAGMEFGGVGADEPTAQTLGESNQCEFQYDFTVVGDGSIQISGLLTNASSVFESAASFKLYREIVKGGGYGNFIASQFVVDTSNTGTVPFSFEMPLVAESGSYRIEMRIYSSSLGSLDQPLVSSALDAAFTINAGDHCLADLNGDGELNFFDVSAFLTGYSAMDAAADFNGDGEYNFFDVSLFLQSYSQGCP